MKTHFDIENLVDKGIITNELDYERALIADRKLRLLAKDNLHFKNLRIKLRNIIEVYENQEWSNTEISQKKIIESDKYEQIAASERIFIENRKIAIKTKLKELSLTQEDLSSILGHKSKTHMSELINGIKPFTIKDLIIINRILKIEMNVLVPNFLSTEEQNRVKAAVVKLANPKIKLTSKDLVFA